MLQLSVILYNAIFRLVKSLHPVVRDLSTFVEKAIPDTKLTLKKYLDAKFEYLSFCLKLKEMDDEEVEATSYDEPLYRVETGNYEYRLVSCKEGFHLCISVSALHAFREFKLIHKHYPWALKDISEGQFIDRHGKL